MTKGRGWGRRRSCACKEYKGVYRILRRKGGKVSVKSAVKVNPTRLERVIVRAAFRIDRSLARSLARSTNNIYPRRNQLMGPGVCVCVCCSGNAGESAGRSGSRIGDLAIPAQVTRGPRSRTSCRNDRTYLRTNSSHATSSTVGQRCNRRGTPALFLRWQATLG